MIYKKEIYGMDRAKEMEYVLANNGGIYINTTVAGMPVSPTHGIYVKQNQRGQDEVYLAGVLESIDFGEDKEANLLMPRVAYRDMSTYFNKFEITYFPITEYILDNIKVVKKYMLSYDDNTLCISYEIENNSHKNCKLKVEPMVTKRDLFTTRRMENLKLTNSVIESGAKINVSILEQLDLYIKSNNMKYVKKERYLNGLIYNQNTSTKTRKSLIDDLYIPGLFECNVKAKSEASVEIYVALENIDILGTNENGEYKYSVDRLENRHVEEYKKDTINVLDEYHELKSLSRSATSLRYIDRENKNMVILDSIPRQKDIKRTAKKPNAISLINKISSIDGNYISLGKYVEANKILIAMKRKIDEIEIESNNEDTIDDAEKHCEDVLSFIEAINRYIQAIEYDTYNTMTWYEYIKIKIEEYTNKKYKNIYMDVDYLIVVNNEKYIKLNSLWYNAIKIYEDLERKCSGDYKNQKADEIYEFGEKIKQSIEANFWDEGKRVLRYKAEGESYATIDMIYSLGLSYIATNESIAIRVVDTAFKELYTPYGMRLAERASSKYDGYVYPKYMTYFVKANLRQTGITRASQKLAYNLVKDLLGEINKYTIGSIKERYLEQNKKAYGPAIDSFTNAEMIRLYKLFI